MEPAPEQRSEENANPVDQNSTLTGQVPKWLNQEFFQRTLWSGAKETGTTVKSCEITPATALGDNYASIVYRAKVETNNGETRSLIVKCLSSNQMQQMIAEQMGTFRREITVYQHILPIYTKMYEERLRCQGSPPWPKCLHCNKDVIVLEDLKPEGFKMGDRKNGLTEEQLCRALSFLGLFHALSFAHKIEDPDGFKARVREDCGNFPKSAQQMFKPMLTGCMSVVEDLVRSWGHGSEADRIAHMKETAVEDLAEAAETMDEETAVLNHGDFWINNLLFRKASGRGSLEMKALDFQMSRYTSPVLDLLNLAVSSTRKEIRQNHWLRLLEEAYLSSLHNTLEKLGHGKILKDGMFSMQWLKQELTNKRMFAFYTSITSTAVAMADVDNVPDMDAMKQEDLKEENSIFGKLVQGKTYQERFRDLFDEFLDGGFFK